MTSSFLNRVYMNIVRPVASKVFDFARAQLAFRGRYLFWTALAFVILNAFWWVAAQWIFVFRPYLNYDYILALMLVPLSLPLAFVGSLLIFLQEMFISNALIYHFDGFGQFFATREFAQELNILEFIKVKDWLLFLSFVAVSGFVIVMLKSRTNILSAFIVLLCAFGADQLNGSSYFLKSDAQLLSGNVGGSSLLNIRASLARKPQNTTVAKAIPAHDLPLTAESVLRWADAHPQQSVLYILVESWGAHEVAAINDWAVAHLLSEELRTAYTVESGTTRFHGATTAAELRHLCALQGNYSARLTEEAVANCLPRLMAERGYRVLGAHGFTARMFRRSDWWPRIGLTETMFVDEWAAHKAPFCGSGMYGVCDDFIIRYLGQEMAKERGFYYHLTLNTHFPVVRITPPADLATLCRTHDVSAQSCALTAHVGQYFEALAATLEGLPTKPLVFVVGDHAPPFTDKASRVYSGRETPYLILRPAGG